jgi:hypothetical protein
MKKRGDMIPSVGSTALQGQAGPFQSSEGPCLFSLSSYLLHPYSVIAETYDLHNDQHYPSDLALNQTRHLPVWHIPGGMTTHPRPCLFLLYKPSFGKPTDKQVYQSDVCSNSQMREGKSVVRVLVTELFVRQCGNEGGNHYNNSCASKGEGRISVVNAWVANRCARRMDDTYCQYRCMLEVTLLGSQLPRGFRGRYHPEVHCQGLVLN